MLDEKDLQAIGQLMDTKIKESEGRMISYFDTRLNGVAQDLEAKISTLDTKVGTLDTKIIALDTKIDDTESRVFAYIEAAVMPKFDILAEGHQNLRETLAPKDRVDALEDELAFMKQVIKAMSRDIESLKKAQ